MRAGLSRSTVQTMDLAAFPLSEVEQVGAAYRHKGSIAARLAAWTGRAPAPPPQPFPAPSARLDAPRDAYAWHSVADLLDGRP